MHAVVCGAGIAGLAAARALSTRGWDVTVVEQSSHPRGEGYMLDFFGPGYEAAEQLGVLDRLHAAAYPIDRLRYVDGRGRSRASVHYDRFARALDGRLLTLMRPDLETALREAVSDDVDLRYGCRVDAVDDGPDQARVQLADGTTVDADLVVAADGIHSTVRAGLLGPEETFLRHLGLHTAAFRFTDADLRAALGSDLVLTDTPRRMLGFYGLRDGDVAAFAVHTGGPRLPDDAQAELRRVYGSMGWIVPAALEQCPPAEGIYLDHVAQVEAPRWHGNRTVLLGDAAYAVSLVAGQGASLAVAGACVLADQLAGHRSVSDALAAYQRLWQPAATARQRQARSGVEWFLPASRWRLLARRTALRLGGFPLVGRLSTRRAVAANLTASRVDDDEA